MPVPFRIALKDLTLLLRDRLGLFWILGFPLLFAIFFGNIFRQGGSTGRLTIAIVNNAGSDFAGDYIERLKKKDALRVWTANVADDGTTTPLTRDQALEYVRKGSATAAVLLNEGFGDIAATLQGDTRAIEVAVDPSRSAESGFLDGLLIQTMFESLQAQFLDQDRVRGMVQEQMASLGSADDISPGQRLILGTFLGSLDMFLGSVDDSLYREGLGGGEVGGETGGGLSMSLARIDTARDDSGKPRSSWDITFPQAMLWAVFGALTSFSLMLVAERREGTLQRLRAAPLGASEILAGKALAAFAGLTAAMALLFLIGWVVFGVRLSSFLHLVLAVASIAACFVGVIMFISTIGESEGAVSGGGSALFILWAMIGGGMVPLFVMPSWMLTVSNFSPVKWGIYALEGAIWRDFSAAEMALPCAILVGIGALFFAGGLWMFRRRIASA